jgi:hypothetical protein
MKNFNREKSNLYNELIHSNALEERFHENAIDS